MSLMSVKDKQCLEDAIQEIIDQKFGKKYIFKLNDLDLNKEFNDAVKKQRKKSVS